MIKGSSKFSDSEIDFMQQRVKLVEKHFSELCEGFASYTRKTAQLRDHGDSLSIKVVKYAMDENLNNSLQLNLKKFAANLAAVQDYRHAQIQRLEAKVVADLTEYGEICKQIREDIKSSSASRAQELTMRRDLEKARGQQHNWQHVSKAEVDLHKAVHTATQVHRDLENKMDVFEETKLHNLKKIFTDFINIELLFHAKALEIYSNAYNNIIAIDAEADLKEFRSAMRKSTFVSRADIFKEIGIKKQSTESSSPVAPMPSFQHAFSSSAGMQRKAVSSPEGSLCSDDSDDSSSLCDDVSKREK